jgi:hypothetical protein
MRRSALLDPLLMPGQKFVAEALAHKPLIVQSKSRSPGNICSASVAFVVMSMEGRCPGVDGLTTVFR